MVRSCPAWVANAELAALVGAALGAVVAKHDGIDAEEGLVALPGLRLKRRATA